GRRKWERAVILKKRIRSAIGGTPICGASSAARSLPGSIIGQIESYLELHETHATVGLPTVQPLRRDEVPYEQALHALVSSHTVEQEEAARIELMRVSRAAGGVNRLPVRHDVMPRTRQCTWPLMRLLDWRPKTTRK